MPGPGEYVVTQVLSAGPLARVALARDRTGRACVVKSAARAEGEASIARETLALRALGEAKVACVPALLDAWAGGMVTEELELPTLEESAPLLRGGAAARDRTARAAFASLAAVHAARAASGPLGMVHGDVSPANVLAGEDRVVVADFGLAMWRGAPSFEHEGAFRGTLAYAAPEVARSESFDGRADDFALAASLLHVATGVPLRAAAAPSVLLARAGTVALDAAHPWRTLAYSLFERAVADALVACLAFDPRDRPRETPTP
jgi:serine/threonine-protein kinase